MNWKQTTVLQNFCCQLNQNSLYFSKGVTLLCVQVSYSWAQFSLILFEKLTDEMSCCMTQPTKRHVRPAKTQIRLGICPVWSEPLLCALWVAKDPNLLQADSKDSDQTGQTSRLIWVFADHKGHFVGFVMWRLKWFCTWVPRSINGRTKEEQVFCNWCMKNFYAAHPSSTVHEDPLFIFLW